MVIVSANYRLDSLGWMALQELEDEDGSGGSYGNYGLLDQRFALQWTQANVHSFGGDPNQVTIFGESAGGFSVCQHIGSPGSSGLFSAAIMESGDCDGTGASTPCRTLSPVFPSRLPPTTRRAAGGLSSVPTRMGC